MSTASRHQDCSPAPSRRAFVLAGAGAVVAAAVAGAAAELARRPPSTSAPTPQTPAVLAQALAVEDALLSGLDAALPSAGTRKALLTAMRADHLAHRDALVAAIETASGPSSAPSTHSSATPPAPSAAQLLSAERAASTSGAARALHLTGADSALLASIAACEASHADLLGGAS